MVRDGRLLLALKRGLSLFSYELPPIAAKEAEDVLVVYFAMWHTGKEELPLLSYPQDWVRTGTACFCPQGAGTVPHGGPAHATGLSMQLAWHSSATVRTTHGCILPLMQALRWLQGLDEHMGAPIQ